MTVEKTGFAVGAFARWCGSRAELPRTLARRSVRHVSHDSRTAGAGDIFVALETEANDGHAFVASALKAGALSAVVARRRLKAIPAALHSRLIVVADPLSALQKAAARWRSELGLLVIGITGSNGKTTTRMFMADVLGAALPVSATVGNWNNHLGVPLSLLRFTGKEYAGIIEMGANHGGEIHTLSTIARPDIAVITNIGYGHVGLFGSRAATTRAKLEIVDGLSENGFLLVNGDDERLVRAARATKRELIMFGTSPRCSVRAQNIQVSLGKTSFTLDGHCYSLAAGGSHYVYSVLPALHLARSFGLDRATVTRAVAGLRPAQMRGSVEKSRGVTFLLDCYNANPSSMTAGLELLCAAAPAAQRVAVVGDMRELGRYSAKLHRELGTQIARAGVRSLVAVGTQAQHVSDGAREAGMAKKAIAIVGAASDAAQELRSRARKGDTVLLKASRGIGLEKAYQLFSGKKAV